MKQSNKPSLRSTIEQIVGIDDLDIVEPILQAIADRLDDSKITTLTGDPKFKFDGSPETFKRLWNAHIADIRASMGIE